MKRIAIFGYGGQGRTVADALRGYTEFVVLDDKLDGGSNKLKDKLFLQQHYIIVAIGDNRLRKHFCDLVLWHGGELAGVVHAAAFVSNEAKIRDGTSIHFGAHVGSGAHIGRGCIVNTNASVGHDCQIGDYVNICDGTILGGGVTIGNESFIGLNATILPRTRIGRGAFIAAGAVVVDHVGDGKRVGGNPATVLKTLFGIPADSRSADVARLTAGPLPKSPDASSSDRPAASPDGGPDAAGSAANPQLGPGHE
jgi:sugar O-acyltransferase (sialic acid O-acetyltransferase NeuD family)